MIPLYSKRSGFTVLEVAIVLVVIALIIGGIFAGESLIRSSQLQSVISTVNSYSQAVNGFRDKYQALPGDFAGATNLWGTDPAGCPDTTYSATPQTTTCNGDGNGHIGTLESVNSGDNYELYLAWQHLANAGMIEGAYTGVQGPGGALNAVGGVNVPASRVPGGSYAVFYHYLPNGDANHWPSFTTHLITFSAGITNAGVLNPVISPAEAEALDSKVDDGLPAFGNVRAAKPAYWPNCVTSATANSAAYNSTNGAFLCGLIFIQGF